MKKSGDTMPVDAPVSVMVVEASAALGRSLAAIFDGAAPETRCVAVCTSGEEAISRLPVTKPEVVFMEINLPGMSGVECVGRMLASQPDLLIIMLTVYDNAEAILDALRAGACGFLRKPVRASDLLAAVREVCAGGSPMTGSIARKVLQAFRGVAPPPAPEDNPWVLTEREREVLEALAAGWLYKEIADKMGLSWHTVHVHIRHVYKKLCVRSRTEAVTKYLNAVS